MGLYGCLLMRTIVGLFCTWMFLPLIQAIYLSRGKQQASSLATSSKASSLLDLTISIDGYRLAGDDNAEYFAAWSTWSSCGRDCKQIRKRQCLHPQQCGKFGFKESRPCAGRHRRRCKHKKHLRSLNNRSRNRIQTGLAQYATNATDVMPRYKIPLEEVVFDLLYGPWSPWTACNKSCRQIKWRECDVRQLCQRTSLIDIRVCSYPGVNCDSNVHNPTDSDQTSSSVAGPALTCGKRPDNFSFRIMGGRPAREGSWPWMVAILSKYKHQYCGGTLINEQWVLTAAHCIKQKNRKKPNIFVRIGEHDFKTKEKGEVDIRVVEYKVHPKWDRDTINSDIALLKLKRPLKLKKGRALACLPDDNLHLPARTLCTTLGWGKTEEDNFYGTNVLREAEIPLVPLNECQKAFPYNITRQQMCAGYSYGGTDTCAGDSGGPLLCPITVGGSKVWVVYGVTSFGEGCGDAGKFGIYTRVSIFNSWIRSVIESKGRMRKGKGRKNPR